MSTPFKFGDRAMGFSAVALVNKATLLCALVASFSCSHSVFGAATTQDDAAVIASAGIDAYKFGDFPAALANLTLSAQLLPQRADIHYWRGLTLLRLNKYGESVKEFRTAASFDPSGRVGQLSRTALAGIKQSVVAQATVSQSPDQKAAADPKAAAISLIRSQGAIEKERLRNNWEQVAQTVLRNKSLHLQALTSRRDRDASTMRSARISDGHGRSVPMYSDAEIQAVIDDYNKRIKALDIALDDEARRARDQIGTSQTMVDGVLAGLESQLNSASGLKLIPDQTNLYVRSYRPSVTKVMPISEDDDELVAQQDRLVLDPLQRSASGWKSKIVPAALTAEQDELSLRKKNKNELLKVKGKLIVPITSQR